MSTIDQAMDDAGFIKLRAMWEQLGRVNPVVFDIGGNIGQSVDRFMELFESSTIFSFEPHPRAFETMVNKHGHSEAVTCVNVALGAQAGTARFHAAHLTEVSSLLKPEAFVMERSVNNNYDHDEIEVRVDTLDRYVRRESVPYIDVLKLDVQGAEVEVLAGASGLLSEHRVGMLFVEVLFAENYSGQCYFDDVWRLLKQHDYRLWDLYPFLHTSGGRLWTGNAIFTSPDVDAALDPR